MSMHKIPLSNLELSGLRAHGLDIGTPSQLSDAFRQGIAWAITHADKEYISIDDEADQIDPDQICYYCGQDGCDCDML